METNTTESTPVVAEAPASLLSQAGATENQITPDVAQSTETAPIEATAPIQPSTFDMNTVINPDGTFKADDWYSQIDPDLAESKILSRFKNIQTVAKSLDHAERLASKKVIQPKDMDEATSKQYYQELGVPETAEGYAFEAPEVPEGSVYDDSTDKWFAEKAIQAKIPKDVANELRNSFIERQISDNALSHQKAVEADAKYLLENENALNAKFPNKTHEVLAGAKRFLDAYGMTDQINGTPLANNAIFLEQMYNNSLAMGEDKLIDAGNLTGNTDTGSEMKSKLNAVTSDPAYTDLKHPDHANKVREFEALMNKIYK